MKAIVFFLGLLVVLAGCTIQGGPNRDSSGIIDSDRWEHFFRRFDGTEAECLALANKVFWEVCPDIHGVMCENLWDYTEVYTFISAEDGLKYCAMAIPKDYNVELI